MPCTVEQTAEQRALERLLIAEASEPLVRMLRSACRVLERTGYDFGENPMLDEWWDRHKKEDQGNG